MENEDVTRLLLEAESGDAEAMAKLASAIHGELHRIAKFHTRRETRDHTIQPTALVNEAYIRLIQKSGQTWKNRSHFFAVASKVMRQVLIDYARARRSEKRGGGGANVVFDEPCVLNQTYWDEAMAIDEALDRLAEQDPRLGRVVEMRFFGGLSEDEIGEALHISARTVKRDWNVAKAFLKSELSSSDR